MKIIYVVLMICCLVAMPNISCIKQVRLSVPFTNQGISISGGIIHYIKTKDTLQVITITKTVPYTQSRLEVSDYITDARVRVANGTDTFVFNYDPFMLGYTCNISMDKIPYNKTYKILIDYNGYHYEGTDSMPSPVAIDTLYITEAKNFFGNSYKPRRYLPRLQFVNPSGTSDLANSLSYFYWGCTYNKVFNAGNDTLSINPNSNANFLLNSSNLYAFGKLDSLNISNTPLSFNLKDTMVYIVGKQYSISQRLYLYQLVLGNSLQSSGPVATPAPPNIQSNVRCITDTTKLVFGYFMAASADIKTVLWHPEDVAGTTQP